jgi:pimeloyl-ACP methyl ester carboxylesterase
MGDKEAGRKALYALLGDLPDKNRPVRAKLTSEERGSGYVLERLTLDLNGMEPAPALFVRPAEGTGPWPAVLYNHAHGGDYALGKGELIRGRDALQKPPYAEALTARGYCALCIDAWAFGERATRRESEIFKESLWRGRVMWGMMVYDSLRALDYLAGRPDVQPNRIATLGMSMGSTMAWWTAALDERVKVTLDICCLTEFEDLIAARGLDGHGIYYYVPRLLKEGWSCAKINELIAPRPHLGLAGNLDPLTPTAGLDTIDRHLRKVYKAAGEREAWRLVRYDCGHTETPEMRAEVLAFLSRWL